MKLRNCAKTFPAKLENGDMREIQNPNANLVAIEAQGAVAHGVEDGPLPLGLVRHVHEVVDGLVVAVLVVVVRVEHAVERARHQLVAGVPTRRQRRHRPLA